MTLAAVQGWTPPAGRDHGLAAVVTTSPRFDPALVPDDVASLAWVVDHPMSWPGHPGLVLFDAVLAGSALMRDRISVALPAAGTRPVVDVLPLAADAAGPAPRPAPGLLARLRGRATAPATAPRSP